MSSVTWAAAKQTAENIVDCADDIFHGIADRTDGAITTDFDTDARTVGAETDIRADEPADLSVDVDLRRLQIHIDTRIDAADRAEIDIRRDRSRATQWIYIRTDVSADVSGSDADIDAHAGIATETRREAQVRSDRASTGAYVHADIDRARIDTDRRTDVCGDRSCIETDISTDIHAAAAQSNLSTNARIDRPSTKTHVDIRLDCAGRKTHIDVDDRSDAPDACAHVQP